MRLIVARKKNQDSQADQKDPWDRLRGSFCAWACLEEGRAEASVYDIVFDEISPSPTDVRIGSDKQGSNANTTSSNALIIAYYAGGAVASLGLIAGVAALIRRHRRARELKLNMTNITDLRADSTVVLNHQDDFTFETI